MTIKWVQRGSERVGFRSSKLTGVDCADFSGHGYECFSEASASFRESASTFYEKILSND